MLWVGASCWAGGRRSRSRGQERAGAVLSLREDHFSCRSFFMPKQGVTQEQRKTAKDSFQVLCKSNPFDPCGCLANPPIWLKDHQNKISHHRKIASAEIYCCIEKLVYDPSSPKEKLAGDNLETLNKVLQIMQRSRPSPRKGQPPVYTLALAGWRDIDSAGRARSLRQPDGSKFCFQDCITSLRAMKSDVEAEGQILGVIGHIANLLEVIMQSIYKHWAQVCRNNLSAKVPSTLLDQINARKYTLLLPYTHT